MFEQLNRITGWNEEGCFPTNQLILIRSNKTNGDFLIHHFLSLLIKQNYQICFGTIAQTFAHYAQAGSKIGSNLETAKEEGKLHHLDLMEMWMTDYTTGDGKSEFNLKSLYKQIVAKVEATTEKCGIILDDLTILQELGFDYYEVFMFVQYLVAFSKSRGNCVVVTLANELNISSSPLLNCLQRLSETVITVEALKSGYSKDVHGKVEIMNQNYITSRTMKKMHFQFKITDKSLLLFAKGTSAAVL